LSSSLLAVQKAVYELLTGDAELMAMITGVFDHVPKGQAFPYVRIGEATEVPWNDFGRPGSQLTINVHAFDNAAEVARLLGIGTAVQGITDGADPTIIGSSLVDIAFEFNQVLYDSDSATNHMAMRFRVFIER